MNYNRFIAVITPLNLFLKDYRHLLRITKKSILEYTQKFNNVNEDLTFYMSLLGLDRTLEGFQVLQILIANEFLFI